jgi:hypothetical protein
MEDNEIQRGYNSAMADIRFYEESVAAHKKNLEYAEKTLEYAEKRLLESRLFLTKVEAKAEKKGLELTRE